MVDYENDDFVLWMLPDESPVVGDATDEQFDLCDKLKRLLDAIQPHVEEQEAPCLAVA